MRDLAKTLNSPCDVHHWTAFVILISIAVLLRLLAFQGYSDSDPRGYAILANDLAHGTLHVPTYNGPAVFPLRFGVYGPTAMFVGAFGLSELTLVAYPFLVSIAGCLLVYVMARWIYCPLAGLICIGIMAVLPIDVSMASRLYPDAIAAFWANLAVALIYLGPTRDRLYQSAICAILGGICIGISWLSKETVVYLVPFIGIYILYLRRLVPLKTRVVSLISVCVVSVVMLSAEALFFHVFAGDLLYHLHQMERNYEQNPVWFFAQSSPYFGWESGGYAKALVKRLAVSGPLHLATFFSIIPALAVVALASGVAFRDRKITVPGVWFVTLLLLFNFASSSFKHYQPLPMLERYFYPLIFPAVLLVGGFAAALWEPGNAYSVPRRRRFWAWALIVAYLLISVRGLSKVLAITPERVARTVAAKLAQTDTIYTDYRTASSLVFFRNGFLLPFTSTTIPYEHLGPEEMRIGTYVLINKEKIGFLSRSYNYQPPSFVVAPPKAWRQVWTDSSAILFRIEETNSQ